MGQEEYQELSSFLKRFVRRLKLLRGVEGLCLTTICALLLFAAGPAVFYLKSLLPYAPLAYSMITGLVLLAVISWTIYRFLGRMPQERAALYIEQKRPRLRNNLINSLQLYPQIVEEKNAPEFSTSMVLALLRTTKRQIAGLRVDELLDTGRLKSNLRLLGMITAPVIAMVLFNPSWVGGTISMLTHPFDHLPPRLTTLEIEPKGVRVARGTPVTIQASSAGALPTALDLITWQGTNSKGELIGLEKAAMENLGEGKFTARIARLKQTLHYRIANADVSSRTFTAEAIDPPEIADMRLMLYPPAYTGLGSVSLPVGDAEGLKGSTIRLDAVATKELVKAEIILDNGRKVPLKINGRELQASLVLFQSQTYRMEVEDQHGFRNTPISYELRVKPDGFPTVDLLRPTEDLEINGDEILNLEYSARDDFGIAEVNLIVKIGAREDKIRLQKNHAKRHILREQYRWDLGKLALREGDEALFFLQVSDNDTISGPKLGTSRSFRLKLKNLKGEHQLTTEMMRDLSARMVDLLADHLETPEPGQESATPLKDMRQQFEQNLADAIKRTEEIMRRTEKDRLSDFASWSDLDALRRNLEFTQNDLLRKQEQATSNEDQLKARDDISAELERMALLSEDIGKRMQAQELASRAQDLARSQERLMDSLDKLQSGDKNLDAIMKQISDLAKTLAALQHGLSQMAQRMPDEFMNAEHMQSLDFQSMQSQLEKIRELLQKGDIEGARKLARELFNQMAQMVAAMQNMQRSQMASEMGRMQGEMQRQSSELQELAREQQEILVNTETINSAAAAEQDAELKSKLERFLERSIAELGEVSELFPDREGADDPGLLNNMDDATVNALLKNLIAKLSQHDFTGFNEGEDYLRKEMAKKRTTAQESRAERAAKSVNDIKSELQALLNQPARALSDAEKRQLRELAQREDILKERTDSLHEKLESLFQLFPQLDPKILQGIGEASQSMGLAQDRLGDLDSRGAVPPEQTALERLSQSQQQMQSAMQQMAQRGQLGNMPMTRLFRRGRFRPFGSLIPLPGMPQFPEFDIEQGFTGLDTEKFHLPGKEDYKAPRNFREEILESLKQGVPPQMKDQIESYFKNLSE